MPKGYHTNYYNLRVILLLPLVVYFRVYNDLLQEKSRAFELYLDRLQFSNIASRWENETFLSKFDVSEKKEKLQWILVLAVKITFNKRNLLSSMRSLSILGSINKTLIGARALGPRFLSFVSLSARSLLLTDYGLLLSVYDPRSHCDMMTPKFILVFKAANYGDRD